MGGWGGVSSTPRSSLPPGKVQVPIVQEAGFAQGPVWTGGKSCPHRDSIPDRPARSSPSLYRLSYPDFPLGRDLNSRYVSVTETRLAVINLDFIDKNSYSKKEVELSVC